tara:strand:+ start:1522 stop:3750 length:2229 start_codon:yes stop_codon:yes gene_type:complete
MRLVIIFFLIFIKFSVSQAEIVKQIIIEGNNRVTDETIKIYGDIEINKNYSEKDINNVIQKIYSTDFFDNVEAELKNNILTIKLKEYPIVNQLTILGEPSKKYKEQIIDVIDTKEKKSFKKSSLNKDVEKIKMLYSSVGFNTSEVEVKVKKLNDGNLDIILDIDRGEKTKISTINFIGDKKIRDRRLRDVVASEEDKFWKFLTKNTNFNKQLVNLDIRLLTNYYRSLGYYNVKINSNYAEMTKGGKINLIYSIDAGPRYTINKISTNVDDVFDKKLFFPLNDIYKKYIGDFYSPFKIKKMLEELDEIIDNNNLQFVEHNVEESVENESINIVFNVFEGKKILVERINIKGNSITDESVIRSEMILDEGDPFTNLSLEKSISNIKSRNIFNTVNYDIKTGSSNDLKIIDISVEEKPTGEISAGAGIGTSGGTLAFSIKENNWLGEGKSLAFETEIDEESITGVLKFNDPNYDLLGNSLNYSLSSQSNDKPDQGYENTVVGASVATSFEQFKNIRASLGLSANYDDLRTQDSASDALKKQSGSFSDISGSYGFSYDQRDRSFKPTSGSFLSFNQAVPFFSDKPAIANEFKSSSYYTISEDVIGSTKFFLSAINGVGDEDVRLSKRLGLSQKRLRGFERNKVGPVDGDDHIGGNYAAAFNIEANLPKILPESSRTDVGVFLDFGNVWGVDYDSSIDNSSKIRSSTGISASWLSPLGPMTFTLSQNLSKASTDKTESFNFSLGTSF